MEKAKSTVALVRCSSYERKEVENAVKTAIELLGGFEEIFSSKGELPELTKESQLVLKPNLLAKAVPEKAVTTHPEVFRAVAKLLQEEGYLNLKYGDSPGNPMLSVEKTAEGCGIKQVAEELGIKAGDFEHGESTEFPKGKVAKKFVLCNEIAKLIDDGNYTGGLINICKMKTHQLERITGAVKNCFGCVYGVNKAATHASYKSPEHFAKMLADLNNLVKPRLHIMDGIVAMEGNGPGSGDPIHMYVLLASMDPVAIDTVFCNLICLDPDLVPTNRAAAAAGVGYNKDDNIDIVLGGVPMQQDGTSILLDEIKVKYGYSGFNVQRSKDYRGNFRLLNLLNPILQKKPVVIQNKCIGCGVCVETCPVEGKAISIVPITNSSISQHKVAMYNYDRCIRCYCCQEMCPQKAISVKKSLLLKIIDRRWKM